MRSKIFCRPAIRLKQGTFAPWHDSDVRTRTGSLISLITLPKQIDAWPKASLIWPARFVACFPLQAGQSRRSRDLANGRCSRGASLRSSSRAVCKGSKTPEGAKVWTRVCRAARSSRTILRSTKCREDWTLQERNGLSNGSPSRS